jgi:poly-gamma-glutamate synthesis protein (capsule biosynthesis protein)
MLAGGVEAKLDAGVIESPFEPMKALLARGDLNLCNLESSYSDRGSPNPRKNVCLRARPATFEHIRRAPFHVAALANNHILDYGPDALADTVALARESGVTPVGAGRNLAEASEPAVIEMGDLTVGLAAFTSSNEAKAGPGTAGAAKVQNRRVLEIIAELAGWTDVTIACMHYGLEYVSYPKPEDREFFRAVIDAGADLVLGHHPHVLQGAEWHNGGFIAYSLGNFVFDDRLGEPRTRRTAALEIEFGPGGPVEARFHPVWINDDFQAEPARGELGASITAELAELSEAVRTGSYIDTYWQEVSGDILAKDLPTLLRKIRTEGFGYGWERLRRLRREHLVMAWDAFISRIRKLCER